MADIERTYNVPLREGTAQAPKHRRAKKAVRVLRAFIAKHMKCEDIRIGPYLNELIWMRGIRSPPHHVEIKAVRSTKKDDNKETTIVRVELATLPKNSQKREDKKTKQSERAKKKKRKAASAKEEPEQTPEAKPQGPATNAADKAVPVKKVVRKTAKTEE